MAWRRGERCGLQKGRWGGLKAAKKTLRKWVLKSILIFNFPINWLEKFNPGREHIKTALSGFDSRRLLWKWH